MYLIYERNIENFSDVQFTPNAASLLILSRFLRTSSRVRYCGEDRRSEIVKRERRVYSTPSLYSPF